jgi:prepilin-type N-terminal cleavage/methylation domain-containing protein
MSLKKSTGFTLIETLIGILIFSIVIVGISYLITNSATYTRDRIIYECLINAANCAIEACRGGLDPTDNEVGCKKCGNFEIDINLDVDCEHITFPSTPWTSNCEEVTVTATYRTRQHILKDQICRFWGGG